MDTEQELSMNIVEKKAAASFLSIRRCWNCLSPFTGHPACTFCPKAGSCTHLIALPPLGFWCNCCDGNIPVFQYLDPDCVPVEAEEIDLEGELYMKWMESCHGRDGSCHGVDVELHEVVTCLWRMRRAGITLQYVHSTPHNPEF